MMQAYFLWQYQIMQYYEIQDKYLILIFMKCCFGERKKGSDYSKTDQKPEPLEREKEKEIRQSSKIILTSSKNKNRESFQGEKLAVQVNEMKKSKLLESISVMDFKMDDPEGISHTPQINTFRYQSILSHNILTLPSKQAS